MSPPSPLSASSVLPQDADVPEAWRQAADAPTGRTGAWPSETLLRGRQVVDITHQGETYRLRLTRQGKLILTK